LLCVDVFAVYSFRGCGRHRGCGCIIL
jgi:hypothetical protein